MSEPQHPVSNFDLLLTLTRIETKQEAYLTQGIDHEARLRIVEKRLWQLPSVATLLAAVGTATGLLALFR